MKQSIKYLIISSITFIVGYVFLKYAYTTTAKIPFLQEIVLIVLGTIATIAITAALLSKQSEVEIEKEQRVKIFDLKSDLYFELIDFIEKVIVKGELNDKDLITLEFLTHKISTIANPSVLKEYANFLNTVKTTSKDTQITNLESDQLSNDLAKLCGKIRYDLLQKEATSGNVQQLIENNIDKL
jgi:hypothetical protein